MKFSILSIILILISLSSFSQTYNMSNTTVTTCAGTFYDSGGSGGNYGSNQNLVMTFCPGTAGANLVFTFTAFNTENTYDVLKVYAGTGTGGALMYSGSGTSLNGVIVQASGGQCITFQFTSDGSVQYSGWAATISCKFPCQSFNVDIASASVPYSSGDTIDVCQGQNIAFTANGIFPNSPGLYTQTNANTTFNWDFGDGTTATGLNVNHTFNNGGGYYIKLTAKDVNNCSQTNNEINYLRVSTTPTFVGTDVDQDTICLGQTVNLTGMVSTQPWQLSVPTEVAGTTFLPDDATGHYATSINHTVFNPGQTLTNINDLQSICVNMEHSYLGDLTITLTCPSGQSITMIQYPNSCGSTFLGVPIDDDSNPNPGTGYDYCWTPNATTGSWNTVCGSYSTLPAGNYQTQTPISNLVGCTLNGNWTMDIFDNLSSDNGYIFSWELHFNPSIIPATLWTFSNSYPTGGMSWTGNGVTSNGATATATPSISGNIPYTFHVIDDFGCSYDTTIYVYVKPAGSPGCCSLPTPNAGNDDAVCSLSYNLNAAASVGTGSWSYTGPGTATFVNANSANTNVTVNTFGNYNFIWSENNGASCIANDTVVITFLSNPTSTFTVSTIPCFGDTATITYTGTSPASATYNWNFNGGLVITGSGQGPYRVKWPNGNYTVSLFTQQSGCYSDTTIVTVNVPELLSKPNVIQTNNSCAGDCLGEGILTFQGGTPPFTYTWLPSGAAPSTDSIASNLCIGNYTVTVTDANGCKEQTGFVITQPDTIKITLTLVNHTHCGQSDGAANISNVTGGVSPYTYLWNAGNNINSTNNTGLPEGFAVVTVTDANSCSKTSMILIENLEGVVCDITSSINVLCNGGNNGSATVEMIANGTPPYTYTWSNGTSIISTTSNNSPINTVNNLTAGFYTVTLVDGVNCLSADSITIIQPQPLVATITNSTNVTCFGLANGSATVSALGGTSPYSYIWSNNATTASVTGLAYGIYNVTVTDANNCTATTSVTITQPLQLTASINTYTNTSCAGVCDGTALATAFNGTSPYTYLWSGTGGTTTNAAGLCAGKHSVTVTDSNLCTTEASVTISEPATLAVTITNPISPLCYGMCNASAIATASGGTAPYNYVWSNGTIASQALDLCAGTNSVTATDSRGCTANTSTTISQPIALTSSITNKTNPTCYGKCDGKAKALGEGGTTPYSYSWSNGATQDSTVGLCAGQVKVTITDAMGCSSTSSSTLTQPGALKINASPTETYICLGQDKTLNATYVTGGTLPLTSINWSTGATGNSITVSPTQFTTYSVNATDMNGCISNTVNIKVYVYPAIKATLTSNKYTICPGDTIQLSTIITGGNGGPYICKLNDQDIIVPPYSTIPIGNDTTIMYELTVSDFCNSPQGRDTIFINLLPTPPNSFYSDTVAGCQPLTVNFVESSPNIGQTYSWNFGDVDFNNYSTIKNPTHIYVNSGIFDVTLSVKSQNGCINKVKIEDMITVYKNPTARFIPDPQVQSIVNPEFYFENISSSTHECYWNFGDSNTSNLVSPFHTYKNVGNYNVELIIKNTNGCLDTAYLPVVVKDEYLFYAPTAFSPDDDGINDIFYIRASGVNPNSFKMIIYDRWGEIVYETNQYNELNPKESGWDGLIKGLSKAETGVYVWYVIYKNNINVEYTKSGNITLIR